MTFLTVNGAKFYRSWSQIINQDNFASRLVALDEGVRSGDFRHFKCAVNYWQNILSLAVAIGLSKQLSLVFVRPVSQSSSQNAASFHQEFDQRCPF